MEYNKDKKTKRECPECGKSAYYTMREGHNIERDCIVEGCSGTIEIIG